MICECSQKDLGKNLNPNPPKGVVEMAEQGIRDPEERLSR